MFIEASGEVIFTHQNTRTGQPVEDQKGHVTIRLDLGDLEKLLKPIIDMVATAHMPDGGRINGQASADRFRTNGHNDQGEPPRE